MISMPPPPKNLLFALSKRLGEVYKKKADDTVSYSDMRL